MKNLILGIALLFSHFVQASNQVVTSTSTLASLVKSIGQGHVDVSSIAKGSQDPHYIEAKPSYMLLLSKAELYVANGFDLESGWLENILRGSRNPKIAVGGEGFLNAGSFVDAIEIPTHVDRSQGDVHPLGNPHFLLDPERAIKVINAITKKLSELQPKAKADFEKNQTALVTELQKKIPVWRERISKTGTKQIITYHKTLNYFLKFADLDLAGSIEPKPGIPPTARQIMDLQNTIKEKAVKCILIESYFETDSAKKLKSATGIAFEVVPPEVEATSSAKDYVSLIEELVTAVEKCK